jgi:hypothetical protein
MLKMGEGDAAGAEAEFESALAEARRIDPGGAREAEVLNYMALFYGQQGQAEKAAEMKLKAEAIFRKFEEA